MEKWRERMLKNLATVSVLFFYPSQINNMQLDTLLLSYQVLHLMVTHIPSDSFVRKDNLVAISLFFFSFIPSSSSFLFLSFYYHPSSASREFMCGTRPYTLPVLHFFFFFFSFFDLHYLPVLGNIGWLERV